VAMELQADCYAGVWAHTTQARGKLEEGDVEEALTAAASVGDDRIQQRSGQRVNVDGFTHGSAAQRSEWFRRGFSSGDPRACDTFAAFRG
jgi:predicted metalloprotease